MNPSSSVASALQPRHRQELAINVLSKQESVSQIAKQEQGLNPDYTIADAGSGIRALRIALSNQKADLLAFAAVLDHKLADIAQNFKIPLSQVRSVCLLMKKSLSTNVYWQKWNHLYQQLSEKFLPVKEAVESAMKSTLRASSLVENLNSRLRNYFFLRKHLNSDYLDLLRFFLNHRTFNESRIPERVGQSPTELMTGEKHPHWLEMLGFELFQRA